MSDRCGAVGHERRRVYREDRCWPCYWAWRRRTDPVFAARMDEEERAAEAVRKAARQQTVSGLVALAASFEEDAT